MGPGSGEQCSHKKRQWGTGTNTQRGNDVRAHGITLREVSHRTKAESEVRIMASQLEEFLGLPEARQRP